MQKKKNSNKDLPSVFRLQVSFNSQNLEKKQLVQPSRVGPTSWGLRSDGLSRVLGGNTTLGERVGALLA